MSVRLHSNVGAVAPTAARLPELSKQAPESAPLAWSSPPFDGNRFDSEFGESLSRTDSLPLVIDPMPSEPLPRTVDQAALLQQLKDTAKIPIEVQNEDDLSKLNGKLPTLKEVDAAFKELAANPEIPFEYIYDGCYARAHLMADALNQKGINNAKLFAFGDLTAKNQLMSAEWWYHVAPLVFVLNEATGSAEMRIMDPSMADHPLKAEEWLEMMSTNDEKIDAVTNPQYYPRGAGSPQTDFEASLPAAHRTAAEYTQLLAQMKRNRDSLDSAVATEGEGFPTLQFASRVRSIENAPDGSARVSFWDKPSYYRVPSRDLVQKLHVGSQANVSFNPQMLEITSVHGN